MRNPILKIFWTKRMLVALLVLAALLSSCGGDDDGSNLNLEHLVDVEGTVYVAVPIGSQVWMAENLNVKKYNDGTDIPYVTDDDNVGSLTTGAYSYYGKDPANSDLYGALYNWHAIGS